MGTVQVNPGMSTCLTPRMGYGSHCRACEVFTRRNLQSPEIHVLLWCENLVVDNKKITIQAACSNYRTSVSAVCGYSKLTPYQNHYLGKVTYV